MSQNPCPTCTGTTRETIGMRCPDCGTDYGVPDGHVAGQVPLIPPEDLTLASTSVWQVAGDPIAHATAVEDDAGVFALIDHSPASVGRIVHFTDGRGCLAAMVTATDDGIVCTLVVFPPNLQPQTFGGCARGDGYGNWHWPERV